MKQKAKFTALVLSAAVLAGAWLLADSMENAAEPPEETPEASAEPIPLAVGRREEITALSWSWDGQTVNLRRSDEGGWEDADDPACPIDADAAEALAEAASSVTASMAVEHVTDLARYGLQPAALTVIAATAEQAVTYEVGNMSITGEYYVRRDGEDTVFLENGALAAFRTDPGSLLALETVPEDIAAVTGLSVVSDAESYDLAYRASGGERGWYRTDGEADVPLVEDRVMELVEQVLETDLSHCVAWQRSDAAAFGLDEPPMKATVRYEDGGGRDAAFTLEYGDYDGDGVYVSFAGSDLIYLTSALGPDALLYPDWTRLTPAAVLTLAVDEIASVRAAFGGAEHELLRLEEETERAVGDDTVTVTDVIWSCNGRVLDGKKTEAWLASLAGLPAETAAYAGEGRQTLLTVTIAWKDAESVPAEVELRSYDSGHCLCVVGGDRSVLVPRSAAEAVLAEAESLFAAA